MRRLTIFSITILSVFFVYTFFKSTFEKKQQETLPAMQQKEGKSIRSKINPGETFFTIFRKHGLRLEELFALKEASAKIHRLKDIHAGQSYVITIDDNNCVSSFTYWIDDDSLLKIRKIDSGFEAMKCKVSYESRIIALTGVIKDNLISALGSNNEGILLALRLSDIFAWDIDFSSDIRHGDTFTIVVQGLYLDNTFKKYGEVLAAEFINDGEHHVAYRFEKDQKSGYYDNSGRSLKKAFLKAPLSFRRISSIFSKKRFHPVLKKYRPHHGVDYAAPKGTPVSATCDGTVFSAGYKKAYGNLVVLRHHNGYSTYYGHLSRVEKNVHRGTRINQGDIIGYVGSTGLATGPHLHYEIRHGGKKLNPMSIKPAGNPIPEEQMAGFRKMAAAIDIFLKSAKYDSQSPATAEKSPGKTKKEG